jgi:iron complex transport system substrate-binding protein
MRIITLLPSATEVVAALGLGDQLVGISHECDYPPELVANKPILTRSAIPHGLEPAQVDRIVSERLRLGESLYTLDYDLFESLKPDLILTQELCQVCAVSTAVVRDAMCHLPTNANLVSLEPTNLQEIFDTLTIVANAAGVAERAARAVEQLNARLARLDMRLHETMKRPRVLSLEWLLPPFSAGHWVPEMVEHAGGCEVISKSGARSMRLDWETVIRAQPDFIFLMPCGYSVEMIERELATLPFPSEWWDIPAVRQGNIFAVNANSFFSRPSPRVVEGIEILAALLHPELFSAPSPTDARRMVLTHVAA